MQGGDACGFDILNRTDVYMHFNTTEDGAKGYFPFLFSTRGFLPISLESSPCAEHQNTRLLMTRAPTWTMLAPSTRFRGKIC